MEKKFFRQTTFWINIFIFLSLILLPTIVVAQERTNCPAEGEGLVPCGTTGCPCRLCDFFVMFDQIFKFILGKVVPPIAVLMVVISGVMFFAAAGDPGKVGKAKSLLTSVAIGLAIIYGAYLLIGTFFSAIGIAEWTGLKEWFKYPCF